jgi:hypothetical protein
LRRGYFLGGYFGGSFLSGYLAGVMENPSDPAVEILTELSGYSVLYLE